MAQLQAQCMRYHVGSVVMGLTAPSARPLPSVSAPDPAATGPKEAAGMKVAAGPTFAQFRLQQLRAVTKPIWLLNLGIHVAAIVQASLTGFITGRAVPETIWESANLLGYLLIHGLPAAALYSGRPRMLQPLCIISHLLVSLGTAGIAAGVAHMSEAPVKLLQDHMELVPTAILAIQDQMSLPTMAVLHALRQSAFMAILVRRLHGDPYQAVTRGVGNWIAMMALSGLFELRTWVAYKRLCRALKQQHLGQRSKAALQPTEADDSVSDLPSPVKPPLPNEGSSSGQGTSMHALPNPSLKPSPTSLLAVLNGQRGLIYTRKTCHPSQAVHVKLQGMDLEQLPSDLPRLLQDQIRHCMPGMAITGLALRSGCVVMALDLTRYAADTDWTGEEDDRGGALLPDQIRHLMSELMRRGGLGPVPGDIPPISIQTPDEVVVCEWNAASESYGIMQPTEQALDSLVGPARLAACQLLSASPSVLCMPGSSSLSLSEAPSAVLLGSSAASSAQDGSTSAPHIARLQLTLRLPSGSQLHGWQPPGAAVPASTGLEQQQQVAALGGSQEEFMLLARRSGGGYLPVSLEECAWVGSPGDDARDSTMIVKVAIAVNETPPIGLRLELWCKKPFTAAELDRHETGQPSWACGHTPALELLVSHMPLLLLPGSCQEAAAELLQHVERMGGVTPRHDVMDLASLGDMNQQRSSGPAQQHANSPAAAAAAQSSSMPAEHQPPSHQQDLDAAACLLEDIGTWLAHHHRPFGHPTQSVSLQATLHYTAQEAAAHEREMSELGEGLLLYAVQHGLDAVATLIVGFMQRSEQPVGRASISGACIRICDSARSSEAVGGESAVPGWLLRAAGCQAEAGNRDSVGAAASLLHAAMASGQPNTLALVLRWGSLYGGPHWSWPWEHTDSLGYTALHVAAAQPASACAALLKTLDCMLPPAQLHAVRNAWLHCRAMAGISPAGFFQLNSDGASAGGSWAEPALPHSLDLPLVISGIEQAGPASPSMVGASSTMTTPSFGTGLTQLGRDWLKPWMSSIVEVWTSQGTDECCKWISLQMALLIRCWAAAVIAITVAVVYRSAMAGCLQYELPHIVLHSFYIVPVLAASTGIACFGDCQAWMLLGHVSDCLGYLATACLTPEQAGAWGAVAAGGADVCYVVLIGAAMDQTPLPQALAVRVVMAYLHSLAYQSVEGIHHPLRRAVMIHVSALVVTTLSRVWQLRAYRRWQRVKNGSRQPEGESGENAPALQGMTAARVT